VALALVNEPEVLLLDEPTAALDPQSRRELHGIVRQMREEGRTVILTTHYIDEAEQLCDRVAIIDHGRIIAQGRPSELVARASSTPRIVVTTARPLDDSRFRAIAPSAQVAVNGLTATITTPSVSQVIIDLVRHLQAENNELLDLHIHKATLEDVFIELTGRTIRD
jgi:ABC-2 type transport system ATP-binding protein